MQISIDTSRDSKEDILKAIHLLHSIIGENHSSISSANSRNIFDSPQPDLPTQQQTFQQQSQQSLPSAFGSFFDNINKSSLVPEKKETRARVELY